MRRCVCVCVCVGGDGIVWFGPKDFEMQEVLQALFIWAVQSLIDWVFPLWLAKKKLFWLTKSIKICINSRNSTEITFRNVKLDETLLSSSKRRSNKNWIRDWVLLRPFHGFNLVLVKAPGNANFLSSDNIRPKSESIGCIIRCTFENYFKPCLCDNLRNRQRSGWRY